MNLALVSALYTVCCQAAGISGNLFALVLFVSPIHTFRRIIRNQSTEQFSGLPYIYTLFNCFICLWYGSPLVSAGLVPVFTVNSIGAIFQLCYICIFIVYSERATKVKMSGLLIFVILSFASIAFLSLRLFESGKRRLFVGYLSVVSLISMFASPLFIINLVIKMRSVEFMPFYLSVSTFLMSLSFSVYGVLKEDPFIYFPNGMGVILGTIQLTLYSHYGSRSREESGEPLIFA